MSARISEYKPLRKRLVCVDSDGCAIDSMEVKHRECFGPRLVKEWGLEAVEEKFLTRWNEINLYSPTRGINRFFGLAIIAEEFELEGRQEIKEWTMRAKALSNDALAQETSVALKKTLAWSYSVNKAIEALPMPQPFAGVKEALLMMEQEADLVVVSSANPVAVVQEWEAGALTGHIRVMLSQNDGSKSECIANLIAKGYDRENVLMIGDAPGDRDAAAENAIAYYPIIPGSEAESWRILSQRAWGEFLSGSLSGEYADEFCRKLGL